MYRTFVEPFLLYCIAVWGHSVRSTSDPLIKLQNRTLRILFECYRTDDAWRYADNKILRLNDLYKIEIIKLCYKQQTNILPDTFSKENMQTLNNDIDRPYTLRDSHLNRYKHQTKDTTSPFTDNCVNNWNQLPDELRCIPNMADPRLNNIKSFSKNVKTYLLTK